MVTMQTGDAVDRLITRRLVEVKLVAAHVKEPQM